MQLLAMQKWSPQFFHLAFGCGMVSGLKLPIDLCRRLENWLPTTPAIHAAATSFLTSFD